MNRRRALVAIDGPAGAGKSTVASGLAARLGFLLVDTGALYRAVALAAQRAGLAFSDEAPVAALAETLAGSRQITLLAPAEDASGKRSGASRVMLGDEDVSSLIRTPEMSLGASRVSAIGGVRSALLAMQRQAGEAGGVVLEGRDIGTVVFPDADIKFFLTATESERASRRFRELSDKGSAVTLDDTLRDVQQRDRADTLRPIAPLTQAEDAVVVDSSDKSISEVIELMAQQVLAREQALGMNG